MVGTPVTNHEVRRIRELAAAGHSQSDIAAWTNRATKTVRYYAKDLLATPVHQRDRFRKFDHQRALALLSQGLNQAQVARRFGVTRSAVNTMLRKRRKNEALSIPPR